MNQATQEPTLLSLKLDSMGKLGEALTKHDDQPVFIFGGIPGEEVLAEVVRRHRSYIAARVVEVKSASPQRVAAPCPYFGTCTGCQWQHISYEHQLELKRSIVKEAMSREGDMPDAPVAPTVPAPQTLGYRNHARFTVGPEGSLGFVNRQNRRFVNIDRCLIMHPWINQALNQLQGRCSETTQLSVRYGVNTGQWLIQPTLSIPETPASGQKHYQEALLGKCFRISAASFFQVNPTQTEQMVSLIKERLCLTGRELVVDAYAGVGTFAVLLSPSAGKVIAIEESASAIKDAKCNISAFSNVEMVQAKTEEALGSLPQMPDALVLDPPRKGCHPAVTQAINLHPPKKIVYISCDPETLSYLYHSIMP
ncbi:class I SAM-dependent RNA methyltransferase [Chloroflexota bacterium]